MTIWTLLFVNCYVVNLLRYFSVCVLFLHHLSSERHGSEAHKSAQRHGGPARHRHPDHAVLLQPLRHDGLQLLRG